MHSVGAEYTYNDQFAFRLGYFYESKEQGGRQYFTMGVGLKYNMLGLNFSYLIPSGSGITRNPLSNTIRFGLVFDLDGPASGNTVGQINKNLRTGDLKMNIQFANFQNFQISLYVLPDWSGNGFPSTCQQAENYGWAALKFRTAKAHWVTVMLMCCCMPSVMRCLVRSTLVISAFIFPIQIKV